MKAISALLVVVSLAGCSSRGSDATPSATTAKPTASAATVASAPSASPSAAAAPAVEPDPLPWADVGFGAVSRDTQNPRGQNVFVGYAGYNINLAQTKKWVEALYEDDLRARGVRWIFAVQGPADVYYDSHEIATHAIAGAIVSKVGPPTKFVVVAAHSSGAYVAHDLLDAFATGYDAAATTLDKVVYFDLDGGDRGLTDRAVARLKHAYFVGAVDPTSKARTPQMDEMKKLATKYPEKGEYFELAPAEAKCLAGASWCEHMTLITNVPHDKAKANGPLDYTDFKDRFVATAWLDVPALAP